jgi:prepilin-type N-terminal cleavage/methylation domain-containing protein
MDRSARESGFSLVELVISVAILTIILTAAFTLMVRGQVAFDLNQVRAESHQNADFAVHRITEIIRGAGSNPLNATTVSALPFISNPGNDVTMVRVISDLNSDGTFDDVVNTGTAGVGAFIVTSEDVTIQYNATDQTLEIVDNTPSASHTPVIIAENIVGFSCPVNDATMNPWTPYAVLVTITAKSSRFVAMDAYMQQASVSSSLIHLRNLT